MPLSNRGVSGGGQYEVWVILLDDHVHAEWVAPQTEDPSPQQELHLELLISWLVPLLFVFLLLQFAVVPQSKLLQKQHRLSLPLSPLCLHTANRLNARKAPFCNAQQPPSPPLGHHPWRLQLRSNMLAIDRQSLGGLCGRFRCQQGARPVPLVKRSLHTRPQVGRRSVGIKVHASAAAAAAPIPPSGSQQSNNDRRSLWEKWCDWWKLDSPQSLKEEAEDTITRSQFVPLAKKIISLCMPDIGLFAWASVFMVGLRLHC